jgi:hypothetical protein
MGAPSGCFSLFPPDAQKKSAAGLGGMPKSVDVGVFS